MAAEEFRDPLADLRRDTFGAAYRKPDASKRPPGVYLGGEYLKYLARNEVACAELYMAFADALPKCRAFWQAIAADELAHAEVVRRLKEKMDAGEIPFKQPRFNLASIRDLIAWSEDWRDTVVAKGITMAKALELALHCEQSMVEANFFSVTVGDSEQMVVELAELRAHTIQHINRLRKESKRLRWRLFRR